MTINCKGQLIDLSQPKVMGILNVTPNSFYDGGKYQSESLVLEHVEKMLAEGAHFIDIGAYSSKPNAEFVSEQEEIDRIMPVVESVLKQFPEALLSIDTFRAKVAEVCLENGAALINDIAAGNLDSDMFKTIAKFNVPYIMMHMRGTPNSMQQQTNYEDLVSEMLFYFSKKINEARRLGITDLIIDPGFGFAKTLDQNYEVLQKLELFSVFELPLLMGISRKSMIYKELKIANDEALNGTTVLNTIGLTKGASILRVHDVKEAVQCVKLFQKTNQNG
ncbi:dihydropteroate synthase [Flavobacterium agrisoli]|uniref:Dihydropteroate synthase n=1 Tax=Flavobacterium agrisoli TaxID=2793066 RepID=A0A934PK74_9FLAO|nr:dihydropteroate synthase [Flavobacterium agrisoli]MBK0368830.1 dihydropteroate synthase [Flavobacterium agrisoli]